MFFIKIKKNILLILLCVIYLFYTNEVSAAEISGNVCDSDTVDQLALIIYHEVGLLTTDKDEAFFAELTTGSIVLNNASGQYGATLKDKIQNLSNGAYQGHSTYKYSSINDKVSSPGEYIYAAGLVLNQKYNVPKNLIYQIAARYLPGPAWAVVYATYPNAYTTAFGTGGASPVARDIFGNTVSTSASDFRKAAKALQLSDYSEYTLDNVCSKIAQGAAPVEDSSSTKITYYKVIYNLDGGKFPTDENSRTVIISSNNAKINKPNVNPIKENNKFIGWYKDNELFDFNSSITSDIELKAKYISFDSGNKKCNSSDLYDPSIDKCISISLNDNSKTIASNYTYTSSCSNGKNSVSSVSCSGACNKISTPDGYEKEYWSSTNTCQVGASCHNLSTCQEEIKAFFYKTYSPIQSSSIQPDDSNEKGINENQNDSDKIKEELKENLKTGDTLIVIAWIVVIITAGYSVYYFKKTNIS